MLEADGDVEERTAWDDALGVCHEVPLPVWQEPHVTASDYPSHRIGRLQYVTNGNRTTVSVKCKQHGCSKWVPQARAPRQDAILRWLEVGRDLLGDNGKREHEALWDALPCM